jgi:hypothetical protein
MISFFNRQSVYIGFDLAQFSAVRSVLQANQIPYKIKVTNRSGAWAGRGTVRGSTGSLRQSPDLMNEYEVFVHKANHERATVLLQKAGL